MNRPEIGYVFSDPKDGLSGYRYVVLAVSHKSILTQAYTCNGDKLGVPTWSNINDKWFCDEWRVPNFNFGGVEGGQTMNYNLPEIRRTTYAKKSGDERRCKTCVLMAHEVTPRDIWAAFTDRKYRCTIAGMRTGATGTCALYTSLEMVKEQNGRGVK